MEIKKCKYSIMEFKNYCNKIGVKKYVYHSSNQLNSEFNPKCSFVFQRMVCSLSPNTICFCDNDTNNLKFTGVIDITYNGFYDYYTVNCNDGRFIFTIEI